MNIKTIILKLFYKQRWDLAFREKSNSITDYLYENVPIEFNPIKSSKLYNFGDPILFSDENGRYLFVEAINRKTGKGEIGVYDFSNGLGCYSSLICEDFHMSYPFVFKMNGCYYMIPESNNAHKLLLYKSDNYPYSWKLDRTLIDNINCVDTTVLLTDDRKHIYILTYMKERPFNILARYELTETLDLVHIEDLVDNESEMRGAGPLFYDKGVLYRPSQRCSERYGECVIFNQVVSVAPLYNEIKRYVLSANNIRIKGVSSSFITNVHTYSCDDKYEFIDYLHYSFSIKQFYKTIKYHFNKQTDKQ